MARHASSDFADVTADQLKRRYVVALGLIALLTLISQLVIQFSIAAETHDSRVVNIAGRQRMLSQKIVKTAYYLQDARSAERRQQLHGQLRDARLLWQRSHDGLQFGDADLGLPGNISASAKGLFLAIEADFQQMLAATDQILASPADREMLDRAIDNLTRHEGSFLEGMDAIVFRFDSEARDKVEFARRLEIALAVVTLLILAVEAKWIFAPAVRRLRRDMHQRECHERDLETLFSASPTALFLVDEKTLEIHRGNGKAEHLMGCDAVGFVHHPISEFLDAKYQINQAFLERIRGGNASNEYEIILINLDNRTVEALASANAITYDNRRSVVIGITDITEIKKAQQTLRYYATFDEMTGLVNRRTGLIMLESEMERARRDGRPLAVCFGDLDGLKSTNDLLGHREGDRLIRALAEALLASVRGGDVAVRLGGDEFLLILHECTESQAHLLIDRVQEKLTQIASRECLSALSASFGVVAFDPACHTKPEALVELADDRMYRVKNAKRGAASAVLVEA